MKFLARHLLFKLFASFLAMAALTVALLWLIQAGLMRDTYLNQRIDQVRTAIDAAALSESIDPEALSAQIDASIIMFSSDGEIIGSAARIPMMGMALRHMQTMISEANFSACEIFTTNDPSTRFALIGQHLEKTGGHIFALLSLDDVDAAAKILRDQLFLITIILALLATLLALVLSQLLSRPILAATQAARQLAAGHLDTRLTVRGQDEIADLTHALNDLGQQLQTTENLRRELIANVSHELRSPLTVIQGYAETVRDVTWPDETKRTDQLTMIAGEAARLTRVVGDILDYSKLQAGAKPANVTEFSAEQALDAVRRRFELEAAARGLKLELICEAAEIRFDPIQFDQVVTNLLANAINHADAGSAIRIMAQTQSGQSIPTLQPGQTEISVTNQGITIPPDELQKIWERFYRAESVRDDQRLGSGLGLAIVRSILEQHRVPYGVISQDRQTTFWFRTV